MHLQPEEMTQSMWEEDSSNPFLNQLLNGAITDHSHFYEVLEDDPLSQQVHISPLDSRLDSCFDCILGLQHS